MDGDPTYEVGGEKFASLSRRIVVKVKKKTVPSPTRSMVGLGFRAPTNNSFLLHCNACHVRCLPGQELSRFPGPQEAVTFRDPRRSAHSRDDGFTIAFRLGVSSRDGNLGKKICCLAPLKTAVAKRHITSRTVMNCYVSEVSWQCRDSQTTAADQPCGARKINTQRRGLRI